MADFGATSWIGLGVASSFLLDWAAVAFDWQRLKPFTKSLAMLLVILWTAASAMEELSVQLGLLIAAQTCGLLGDIMLLFPEQAFTAGLGAFLVGHIFYLGLLVGFYLNLFGSGGIQAISLEWLFLGTGVWAAFLILFYRILRPLPEQGEVTVQLWVGIQAYAWLLSAMVALALVIAIQSDTGNLSWFALPLGALLFLVSDAMLTYNRFLKPFHRAQLWVRITYHLAQFALAWGFVDMIG